MIEKPHNCFTCFDRDPEIYSELSVGLDLLEMNRFSVKCDRWFYTYCNLPFYIDDVKLDPMTNHPWLLLSDDRKKVQEAHCTVEVTFSAQRYDGWPCVLAKDGLSSGRHYWEVTLANNGYWKVGLTTASSKRHGRFPMTPKEGYWVLWRSTRHFYACTQPETTLPLETLPYRMGVYLDYDEGQISFYNVETRAHIYTFTDDFREELYPLFAPLDGRTLITISSPKYES
uniref:B30.2/SPRY domain-containing protein n=1 Tax=Esox lucius TaxID=8010 RepID=A0AAY5JZY6_ESOLU